LFSTVGYWQYDTLKHMYVDNAAMHLSDAAHMLTGSIEMPP